MIPIALVALCGFGGILNALGLESENTGSAGTEASATPSSQPDPTPTSESTQPAEPRDEPTTPPPAPAAPPKPALPASETAFIAAVQAGRKAFDGVDNEFKRIRIQDARDAAACRAIGPARRADGWIGNLKTVETTLGGDSGVVEVEVAKDIMISTWNNALSDFDDNTLIEKGSPLYRRLGDFEEGDEVRFSGSFVDGNDSCIGEQSLTEEGTMSAPSFTFQFSSIERN